MKNRMPAQHRTDVNRKICRVRPVEQTVPTAQQRTTQAIQ
jgi:hypothetical protein